MRWNSIELLLAACFIYAIVLEPCWANESSGGGGWRGEDEFEYVRDDSFPKEDVNPDANQQKRLVVDWGKVSMGIMDYDARIPTWNDDNSLHENRAIAIRGKLMIVSDDGKSRKPIDWLQGIRVVVSRLPDKKHDWSNRQEDRDAAWDSCVIRENGEFLITISPGQLRRSVGKERDFQVALSLGEKEGTKITWRNTFAVLPQSVTMLTIPGPPAINETMQIINGAPSYNQCNFNPAKLVRAVNHLIPMGKEKSIHELREFLKIAIDSFETDRVDDNIDTSDKTCVFLIVHLLFERIDSTQDLLPIYGPPVFPNFAKEDKKFWPLRPLALQDDIPFLLAYLGGGSSGPPQEPASHVDWAEEHGKIRTKLLRPLDNPMLAAGRLINLPQTKRLSQDSFNKGFQEALYQQAWNIIIDADPEIPKSQRIPVNRSGELRDGDGLVKAASKFKIQWSEPEQRYIMK